MSFIADSLVTLDASSQQLFNKVGLYSDDDFLSVDLCRQLLAKIQIKQTQHALPVIKRKMSGRSLDYQVMDGKFIQQHLHGVGELAPFVIQRAQSLCDNRIHSLRNSTAAINVNILHKGGEYRWHYDRNAITAILYLNEVEGGETELLPNSRNHLGPLKRSFLQRWLDQRLINKVTKDGESNLIKIAPKAGRLVIMKGDSCLHSVNAVLSDTARYNLVFSFDSKETSYQAKKNLDPYLYTVEKLPAFDPNYNR